MEYFMDYYLGDFNNIQFYENGGLYVSKRESSKVSSKLIEVKRDCETYETTVIKTSFEGVAMKHVKNEESGKLFEEVLKVIREDDGILEDMISCFCPCYNTKVHKIKRISKAHNKNVSFSVIRNKVDSVSIELYPDKEPHEDSKGVIRGSDYWIGTSFHRRLYPLKQPKNIDVEEVNKFNDDWRRNCCCFCLETINLMSSITQCFGLKHYCYSINPVLWILNCILEPLYRPCIYGTMCLENCFLNNCSGNCFGLIYHVKPLNVD